MRKGCATLIVLNKWDVTETDLEDAKARVAQKLRLRPRVLTASALTGRNVTRLLVEAVALADRARGRIATAELNRFVAEVQSERQPPGGAREAAADLLRGPGRDRAAALSRPRQRPQADRARLRATSSRTGCASATGSRACRW